MDVQTILWMMMGIILAAIGCGYILKKENIVRLLVISVLGYFSLYIIVSGLLFWANAFSIMRALIIAAAAEGIFDIFKGIRHGIFQVEWEIKTYMIPFIIILCAMPFVLTKYEFFGMGQDEGVYQTQAIQFMYGYNDVQRDFEEYDMLESEDAKEDFRVSLQEDLIGLYNYDTSLPFASEAKEISDVSAVFHGIPTFPALLGLFGKMFGIRHMSDIQTIFYICAVFLLYFILTDLNTKRVNRILCTILFAFSPLILWVSKSALTEIGITALILGFIYLVLSMKDEKIYLSVIPLAAMCFFHLTIYTMFPVFVAVYLGLYAARKKPGYLIAAALLNTAFALGMTMTMMIAGTYSFTYNFAPVYRFPGISQENTALFFWIVSVLIYLICLILYVTREKLGWLRHACVRLKYVLIRACLVGGVLYQAVIILSRREKYQGGFGALRHLTLSGYGFSVGIVVPAVAGIIAVFCVKKVFSGLKGSVIALLFMYCILLYACYMKKDINYYYYYGRYLAPYISIVILFSASALELISKKIIGIAGICSLCILAPYEKMLLTDKDDTRVTWDALENVIAQIRQDSIVIITRDNMKFYYLPLRAMTGAACFPETEAIVKEIQLKHENYYYISNDLSQVDDAELALKEDYQLNEDNNWYDGRFLPFPLDITREDRSTLVWYFGSKE